MNQNEHFNRIQMLIDSIIRDKNALQSIQTLTHTERVQKIQRLKQNHADLTREVDHLKKVHNQMSKYRSQFQNEIRTQEHYNTILINDKKDLIEKIEEETRSRNDAMKKLNLIKEQVKRTSNDYKKQMETMKNKQLFNARCQTDKLSLEKQLSTYENNLKTILSRIESENTTRKNLLNEIAELHEKGVNMQRDKTQYEEELNNLQKQNKQMYLQIINERENFEVLKRNAEISKKLLNNERSIATKHLKNLSKLKHLQEQIVQDTASSPPDQENDHIVNHSHVTPRDDYMKMDINDNHNTFNNGNNDNNDLDIGKENHTYDDIIDDDIVLQVIPSNTPHRKRNKRDHQSVKTTKRPTVSIVKSKLGNNNRRNKKSRLTFGRKVDHRHNNNNTNNHKAQKNIKTNRQHVKKKKTKKRRKVNFLGLFEEL